MGIELKRKHMPACVERFELNGNPNFWTFRVGFADGTIRSFFSLEREEPDMATILEQMKDFAPKWARLLA